MSLRIKDSYAGVDFSKRKKIGITNKMSINILWLLNLSKCRDI